MADEIPQYKDDQPVFQPVNVSSSAESYEAFARTLGQLSDQSASKVEDIQKDQSNASLMQSASQMQTAKVDSQIAMIKHPDQAAKISNNTATIMDSIAKNTIVNTGDRQRLQALAVDNYSDVRLKSAQVGYEQGVKSASISFWDNYPTMMKGIQDSLDTGDFNKAKILEDTMHGVAKNAAQIGAITPEQFGTIVKSNSDLYERTNDMLKMANNPGQYTAADYHSVVSSPFNQGTFNNVDYPVNGNTQSVASSYNFDKSMAGQYSNLYEDKPLNFGVISQSTEKEYADFKSQWMGVNQVKAAITSGMPLSQVETRMKSLEAQPKLSAMENGELNYWKSFQAQLKTGDGYVRSMAQTTLGGQYTQEYNQTSTAIMDSSKTQSEKFEAMRDNDNAYIGHMATLGTSQHLDPGMIRPIPSTYVNNTQSAFIKDAPVAQALSTIAYLKPENRPYLADSMQKPNQAVAVFLAGATLSGEDTTFQSQLLQANQDRDYSSLLKTGKDETKDTNIWDDMSSDARIKDIYSYFGKLPGGIDTQNGLKNAATNYVLYRAATEGDVNLNGKAKYENDFMDNVSKGFNIVNGTRYVFNASQLKLRKADMDTIADYALSEAYKNIHQGRTEQEFQAYTDLIPLHATNTPDGRIVVIDKAGHAAVGLDGKAAFDMPYTTDMLPHAQDYVDKSQKQMAKIYDITENIQKEAKLHPIFSFVGGDNKSSKEEVP